MRGWFLAAALAVTGGAGAATRVDAPGDAGASAATAAPSGVWQATYAVHDARGPHTLVVVCDDDEVELRVPGEPTRRWQRRADGIEHTVVFADRGRAVVFHPGDLRALGRELDWSRIRGLVPVAQRPSGRAGSVRVAGRTAAPARMPVSGAHIDVAWRADAGLPARYVRSGAAPMTMRLRELRPATPAAFTALDTLRIYDAADLGDEELDPFARSFIVLGF